MQITLNQQEIETALINYVGNQGISITGKNVDVTLIAGRGPNGMSASIAISNDAKPTGETVLTVKGNTASDKEDQSDAAQDGCEANEADESTDAPAETDQSVEGKSLFG